MSELNRLDLEKAAKSVSRLLKSEEGKAAIAEALGGRWVDAEDNRPTVITLMPSHEAPKPETGNASVAIDAFTREHAKVIHEPCMSSSVVHWVRNDLLSRVYAAGKEFDYILFWDDDIVPPQDAIVKLLGHKKEIVAGACTVRQDPPLPNFRSYNPETYCYNTAFEWSGEGCLEVGGVGTGFMLISKVALDVIGEYYLSCTHEQKFLGMSKEKAVEVSKLRRANAEATHNKWWFEFLKHPKGEGEYGEDISFCFKARECGIPIFVDTTVRPGHIGRYPYSLDDFIPYREEVLRKERAKLSNPQDIPDVFAQANPINVIG